MEYIVDYKSLESEIDGNKFEILEGKHDEILIMLEDILEKRMIVRGDKLGTYELLSYIKLKLNKPLEAYYYGYESSKTSQNSIGMIIAAISLFKINKNSAIKFVSKNYDEIKQCFLISKFNIDNFKNDYEYLKLMDTIKAIESINRKKINDKLNFKSGFYEFKDEYAELKSYKSSGIVNMHLIKINEEYLILDCGAEIYDETIRKIDLSEFLKDIPKEKIKGAVISHAHLDHYGSLDELYRFTDNIFMGKDTFNLIKRTSSNKYIKSKVNICENYCSFKIGGYEIIPIPNGHILGSMAFFIKNDGKNIFYTGDFCLCNQNTVSGLKKKDIENLMKENGEIDYLITESTYGYKEEYLTYTQRKELLKYFIKLSYKNNIKVFIPSFAIGRAQECMAAINEEEYMYVLIDGLAKDITKYYNSYSICSNLISSNVLMYSKESIHEKYKNAPIIISSSGMLQSGSRAMEYYDEIIKDKMTTIIKCGYMDEAVYNNRFAMHDGININVIDINLSAHAQHSELIELIKFMNPVNIMVVHGKGIEELNI